MKRTEQLRQQKQQGRVFIVIITRLREQKPRHTCPLVGSMYSKPTHASNVNEILKI